MATRRSSSVLQTSCRSARCLNKGVVGRNASTAATAVQRGHDSEPFPAVVPPSPPPPLRAEANNTRSIRNAKPFSEFLTDTFHRQHDYLRISVTERCNLRCLYCMPKEGIELSPNKDLLTSAELYYLSALFVNQGVNKIRLTGGEPTVRKDIVPLMQQIGSLRRNGLKELAITTNGISLHRKLDAMVEAGLTGVNISWDTLDPFQFQLLTRRQGFEAVMKSINRVQEMNKMGAGVKLKINAVAMRGLNDHQIIPFVEKTREEDIEIRFIEYMPFGGNKWSQNKMLPYSEMLDIIRQRYPTFARLRDAKNDTSKTWQVPGFKGRIGFITSMTHNFCDSCNRLRVTSDGNLKVCLHGNTEVSLRDLLRKDNDGEPMDEAAFEAMRQIEIDRRKSGDSRGDGEDGWLGKEQQLLGVIGAAVKRKKAKHAGMGELENMKNRPMILIDEPPRPISVTPSRRRRLAHGLPTHNSWPAMPVHLLPSLPVASVQFRWSSSDTRKTANSDESKATPSHEHDDKPQADASSSSGWGFQSLSGLFRLPVSGRHTKEATREPHRNEESQIHVESNDRKTGDSNAVQHPASLKSEAAQAGNTVHIPGSRPIDHIAPKEHIVHIRTTGRARRPPLNIQRHINSEAQQTKPEKVQTLKRLSRIPSSSQVRSTALSSVSSVDLGHHKAEPSPFVRKPMGGVAHLHPKPAQQPERPWGLNYDDFKPNDPLVSPNATTTEHSKPPNTEIAVFDCLKAPGDTARTIGPTLTHVKSSGEAHMVDVGAKPSTRRVAVASSVVRFTNDEPIRQISENNNKKGDVLGVARIAGLMAAKRTSDLIPLCHQINITKTDVDVKLVNPGELVWLYGAPAKRGFVVITTHVETFGPTGVEMEALTSAMGAALTVYDMCKAVDRQMSITRGVLLYKSGGRSGLFVDETWAAFVGRQFFLDRDLEMSGDATFGKADSYKTWLAGKRHARARARARPR